MTNSKELFNDLVNRILINEDKSEIQSIIYLFLEKKYGMTKTEILANKEVADVNHDVMDSFIDQINKNVPVQYVIGSAEFYGRDFYVNPSVLIPRPETELIVDEVIKIKNKNSLRILDIGTGSGCIAITLALEIPDSMIYATDVNSAALSIAKKNSKALGALVEFHQHDILNEEIPFQSLNMIVSNPPYISQTEKMGMRKNVLDYEPHLALFAPPDDPLAFYKSIAEKSIKALSTEGMVLVEINEHFGKEVAKIFSELDYRNIHILKDLDNKERIVTAIQS